MKKISYILFRLLNAFFAIIPFRFIYFLSDIASILLMHVFRYRRAIVYKNLRASFPQKSNKELNMIARECYKNLCDVALESIKGYTLGVSKLSKRYICLNPEVSNRYFEEGRSVIFALSHYANWEWGTQVAGSVFKHKTISFYKPMANKYIDDYVKKQRALRGMELCSIYQTKFIFREEGIPRAYFMVSDQHPSKLKKAYWVKFLNQDTACIHGVESYARLFNLPVIYLDMQRVKRGYYTVEQEVICDNPLETKVGEITELYMKKLEKIITLKPEPWLWSHRRWKYPKPENVS